VGYVVKAGAEGVTVSDLNVRCKPFRAESGSVQDMVIEMMKRRGDVVMGQRPARKNGHAPKVVMLSPEFVVQPDP